MNPIDDMFRDGLSGRKGEIPADMWSRVNAGKASLTPEGEGVDQYFSDALKDRPGDVPADMWQRIAATGVPAAATLDQVFAGGLRNRTDKVPAGMWSRIWEAHSAAPVAKTYRFLRAAAILLFILTVSIWAALDFDVDPEKPAQNANIQIVAQASNMGSAAGAETVDEAGSLNYTPEPENRAESISSQETSTAVAPKGKENQPTDPKPVPVTLPSRAQRAEAPPTSLTPPTTSPTPPTSSLSTGPPQAAAQRKGPGVRLRAQRAEAAPTTALPTHLRATATAPLLRANLPIQKLELAPEDPKTKRKYEPKTPSANSFRAANRHRLQTEFLFGAFYANQQFTTASTSNELLALRTIRETRENPGLSYQVSLRGAYTLNERLVLRSGLTYSEIRNKFDYEDVVNGRLSLLTINNHIRQLEAPVLLGLLIPGRRLNVSLNAGLLVNLTTSVQGRFLRPDSLDPLNLATDGQYRSNVGLGFMTSLSTTYVIGKKQPFVLLVEPFFKAYPGSFTSNAAPLKETYWAAGLQLGVRKGF